MAEVTDEQARAHMDSLHKEHNRTAAKCRNCRYWNCEEDQPEDEDDTDTIDMAYGECHRYAPRSTIASLHEAALRKRTTGSFWREDDHFEITLMDEPDDTLNIPQDHSERMERHWRRTIWPLTSGYDTCGDFALPLYYSVIQAHETEATMAPPGTAPSHVQQWSRITYVLAALSVVLLASCIALLAR